MKIAVIGSGISGLSAAYHLSKKYNVDLFEKNDHFGGHSYTYDIKESNKIIIVSAIDNLIKGGSGQAVQNMNVAFNFKETMGLI